MAFVKREYDQAYAKEHFKRVPLDMPLEEYENMKKHMDKLGIKRVNTYIRELIRNDVKSDEEGQ